MLERFTCKHVGKTNDGGTMKVFIRVAEVRGQMVTEVTKNCPDCK